jgi:hypothetical protein
MKSKLRAKTTSPFISVHTGEQFGFKKLKDGMQTGI